MELPETEDRNRFETHIRKLGVDCNAGKQDYLWRCVGYHEKYT